MTTPSTSDEAPQQLPVVALEGPLPSAIADLASLEQDIEYVLAACETLLPLIENQQIGDPLPPGVAVICRALWESAVVAYGRCFATGRALALPKGQRRKANEYIDGRLDAAAHLTHGETRRMRDKHVAHRVIDAEQMKVLLVLNPESMRPGVDGVLALGVRHAAADRERVEGLLKLARDLLALIVADREALQDELIAYAACRIDSMYALAERSITGEGEPRSAYFDEASE